MARLIKTLVLFIFIQLSSCNPFAPGLDDVVIDQCDRRTFDGFFECFKNAYEYRDSTRYGQIVADTFIFTYFDFINNTQISWDRGVEMRATYNMFNRVKSISLQWNYYIIADTISDTLASIERAFNLFIFQDDQNVFRGTGSAYLILARKSKEDFWKMASWYDKSDF
ncbi:MAG: hypothetical protein IIA88_07160 [Bacteroidetes bacterium]|nr:hypothetical protein [Bacteroidota bacterium]